MLVTIFEGEILSREVCSWVNEVPFIWNAASLPSPTILHILSTFSLPYSISLTEFQNDITKLISA